MSTKRSKIGYFEPKKRSPKIKKVRQKCQFLIFFNEIFTVYAVSDGEYEKIKIKNFGLQGARMGTHDPLGQSVNYWYKSMRCCAKVINFLKSSYIEKKIKWVSFCLWKPWQELKVRWFLTILTKLANFDWGSFPNQASKIYFEKRFGKPLPSYSK